MKKNVYIMSAKYAPGHFSHMLAYYKLFQETVYEPLLFIDPDYEPFHKEYPDFRVEYTTEKVKAPDMLFIYNLSPDDSRIVRSFRKANPAMKVIFVYHEPWYGIKGWLCDLLHKNESPMESGKALARFFFVKRLIKSCDQVILPSGVALKHYQKYCARLHVPCCVFPLVFTDECGEALHMQNKRYFSFISTASASKHFELFLDYIRYKAKRDPTAKFQIATRTDIAGYIDDELNRLIQEKRLLLTHGHSLSNAEINHAYAISSCTWMVYARSTQSGALCKSFMFGTPVIASDIGSFRETVNEDNGVVLGDSYTLADIDKAYESIKAHFPPLCEGARRCFLSQFYYASHRELFRNCLSVAGCEVNGETT